jgi:uncharacterized membrane protein
LPLNNDFYLAVVPFIFMGAVLRVMQDAALLPRSMAIFGLTIYPFITPGIYIFMFVLLAVVTHVSNMTAKSNFKKLYPSVRDAGIGLTAVLTAILFLFKFGRIGVSQIFLFVLILFFAILGLLIFEFIKSRFYNKGENKELINLERTAVISQILDGAATFVAVTFGNYSEQHIVANAIFSLGSPFAFYIVKILFVIGLIFALRKESDNKEEQIFILVLVTIIGLAPGIRDALRLFFNV